METPNFLLGDINGIKWSPEQLLFVDALNKHDCILYRSPRRNGTTFAICGLIATIMQNHPPTAHAYSILVLGTTEYSCNLMRQQIKEMFDGNLIYRDDTILTQGVNVTIRCSLKYKRIEQVNLLIVDDADHQDASVFYKYAIPMLQMKKNGKCLFTYTTDSEKMQKLETLNLDNHLLFHRICISRKTKELTL